MASSSPSPPLSNFGDSLLCPVCFVMFEGRILQCSHGHSVCEKCHKKLNNECPQCRCTYVGTRNYILEDVIKQLKVLKSVTSASSSSKDSRSATSSKNKIGGSEESEEFLEYTDKITNMIAKLVASIPKLTCSDDDDEARTEVASGVATVDSDEEIQDENAVQISVNNTNTTNLLVSQPKGFFACRMINCIQQLPSCRMLNHLRSHHNKNLLETRVPSNEHEFVMHWIFPCSSYCHGIQITGWGLFFLIVNVKKEPRKTIITGWVQCIGYTEECAKFQFSLEMRLGNSIASYSDYCYGASSTAEYIELTKQCLSFETNITAKRLKEIAVDVNIYRSTGQRVGRLISLIGDPLVLLNVSYCAVVRSI